MYHLYTGSGSASDCTGTNRVIAVEAMISDQLWDRDRNQPVQVIPGKKLEGSGSYLYKIADWRIAVDKIGSFIGQSGQFFLQDIGSNNLFDKMWHFYSDLDSGLVNNYSWGGAVNVTTNPSQTDWGNPSASNYAQLPYSIKCESPAQSPSMGGAIVMLFAHPGQSYNYEVIFTLQRV